MKESISQGQDRGYSQLSSRGIAPKFYCFQCSKPFLYKSVYEEHMNIHTGERKFICHYCGKNFARERAVKIHIATVQLKALPK